MRYMSNLNKYVRSIFFASFIFAVGCAEEKVASESVPQSAEPVDYESVDQGVAKGDGIATLRKGLPIDAEFEPARMPVTVESAEPRKREYPMQPPTIPHKIGGYEINLNVNKCMSCHGRSRIEESGAKMVSVTHYQDRDHQSLASISATRYFCTQCHVVQTDAKPLVKNDFVDMDQLLK